jgi:hypothetical protein
MRSLQLRPTPAMRLVMSLMMLGILAGPGAPAPAEATPIVHKVTLPPVGGGEATVYYSSCDTDVKQSYSEGLGILQVGYSRQVGVCVATSAARRAYSLTLRISSRTPSTKAPRSMLG